MNTAFTGTAVFLALLSFMCLYRAYAGPTAADRVVAINVITTKIAMLIVLLSIITGQEIFVDVALIYAMMGFIATICVSKYIEKGKLY
ncbi:MAG: cation:proton antiporter [Bacillota bacterium]|nr:cation:proton antiporter [Bacillota bacterium]MDW7677759.1 cation:proton antiporter [Bacillota bacterium]